MLRKLTKLLGLLFCVALLTVVSQLPVKAANTEQNVYFENTASWSNVYIYYWSDSNTNFTTWPGSPMTQVQNNIYSFTLPAGVEYVIFNNWSGTQTADLPLPQNQNFYHYDSGTWDVFDDSGCDHTFGDAVETPATCITPGSKTTTCTICGFISKVEIPAIGHQYEDDLCTLCGQSRIIISSGTCGDHLTWALDDQGLLTINGSGPMDDYATSSLVPWSDNRTSVTAVRIGDGITTIGDRAFYGCTELIDVTIGSNVTTIGSYAFRGCTKLNSIPLPESITLLKNSAFRACTALTFVTLKGNAPEMENDVFSDGASSRTFQYTEGTTGYDVAPWTGFTHKALHIGTYITTITPTCTTDGSRYIDCAYCQATFTEVLPASGHQYVDGICTVCSDIEILYRGTCGSNLNWTLNAHGILAIHGSGSMYNYDYYSYAPWYQGRQKIETVMISEGVTSIGDRAFKDCTSLQSITIPEGVTSIGDDAFYGCSSLRDVYISNLRAWVSINFGYSEASPMLYADNLYLNNKLLTDVIIPDGVTLIGDYAFRNCSSLESIIIPESVTSIGSSAFEDCGSLQSIIIPESVTSIGSSAFSGCSSLQSITIPKGVTSISYSAFYGCSSLQSIIIPESVTSIGGYAFQGCSSLQNITIPEGVTRIISRTFYGCSSLTSITIPSTVTQMEHEAFYGCTNIDRVYISDLSAWCRIYFAYRYETYHPIGGHYLLSSSPLTYGASLYLNNEILTELTIPNDITRIRAFQFSDCRSLKSITFHENVKTIDLFAFAGCYGLTDLTIPNSVTSIGECAFAKCSNVKSIKFMGSAPSFEDSCFSGVNATAYHSCANTSWTDKVKSQIDGNLTWKEHLLGDYVYNEDATCTQNGTQTAQCPDCGEEEIIEAPNTATGHSWNDGTITENPGCTVTGLKTFACINCGETRAETVPATGHTFDSNGYCTVCGNGHDIIINLTDSYGDGWNGCAIKVYADDTLLTTATISSGSSNQVILAYNPSTTYVFKWSNGSYSSECSFEISFAGKVLATGKGSNYSGGQTIYTLEASTSNVTLGGSIIDFGDGDVTLTLTPVEGEAIVINASGSYSITAAPGEYILTVSMANHVTRQYAVTLGSEAVNLDVKIHLIGDIDGNGKVNVGDVAKLNGHIKGTAPIADEYQLLCANINGGKLNMGDTAALYSHIRGTKKLY